MILVDTSIWVDHLRAGDTALSRLLDNGAVLGHAWVTGELALGSLAHRGEIIGLLLGLAQAAVADDAEIRQLIERESLYGKGIGYVDAQLLASARLTPDARLWTRDKRLADVAATLDLAFEPTEELRDRAPDQDQK